MAKVALTRGNKTQIDLTDSIGYTFNPSNASILSVRIEDIEHEPNKLAAILTDVASVIWRKNTTINTYKRVAKGWEDAYNERNAAYRRLKKRLYVAGISLLAIGSIIALVVGV